MYAFILGASSERVVEQVTSATDINSASAFPSINGFLTRALRQSLVFNRILLTASAVTSENDLRGIKSYLENAGLTTQVVLIAREWEGTDMQVVSVFHKIFSSPIYTDYTLKSGESVDIKMIAFACTGGIDDIRSNHSTYKDEKPVVRHQIEDKTEASPKYIKKGLPNCTFQSGVVKSFTYGGKIFSRHKLTKKEAEKVQGIIVQANALLGRR